MKYYVTDIKAPMNLFENRRYINVMIIIIIMHNLDTVLERNGIYSC